MKNRRRDNYDIEQYENDWLLAERNPHEQEGKECLLLKQYLHERTISAKETHFRVEGK